MKKNFISPDKNIRAEVPQGGLTAIIGMNKLLEVGDELKIYHYLAGKPDDLLSKWIVTDNGKTIFAKQWVDSFETAVAAEVWDEELRIQENSAEMIELEKFADLPF